MGNIYFEQKRYAMAIKMYHMALDSTSFPNTQMRMRMKKNVGLALVKLRRFG